MSGESLVPDFEAWDEQRARDRLSELMQWALYGESWRYERISDAGPGWRRDMWLNHGPIEPYEPPVVWEMHANRSWRLDSHIHSVFCSHSSPILLDVIERHTDLLERPYRATCLTPIEVP